MELWYFVGALKRITCTPNEAETIKARRPYLRFFISPFIRNRQGFRDNSTNKTQMTMTSELGRSSRDVKKSIGTKLEKSDDICMTKIVSDSNTSS